MQALGLKPDIIVLDFDCNGEIVAALQADLGTREIPVIALADVASLKRTNENDSSLTRLRVGINLKGLSLSLSLAYIGAAPSPVLTQSFPFQLDWGRECLLRRSPYGVRLCSSWTTIATLGNCMPST